jgi:hypothetical protein
MVECLDPMQHGEATYHELDEEARIFTEQGIIIEPIRLRTATDCMNIQC